MENFSCSFILATTLSLVLLVQISYINCFECKHNGKDFSLIAGTWEVKSHGIDVRNFTYYINICGGVDKGSCPGNTSVCMVYDNGTALSAGSFSSEKDEISGQHNEEEGASWLAFAGDKCPLNSMYNATTLINVRCGLTMGAPKFLQEMGCVSYFEWETDVACTGIKPEKEVRCVIYVNNDRYDLSPLAMTKGGYLVSSESDTNIYINVCRDIHAVAATSSCPSGSGACKVTDLGKATSTSTSLGQPTTPLTQDADGRLKLVYTSSTSDATHGCTAPATTTIVFICPKRGQSKDPIIVEDFNCQYVIEWETEYACPERTLSSNTCKLTKQDADINIDLTPLTRTPGTDLYKVVVKETRSTSTEEYDYFLNVCDKLGIPCPDDDHVGTIAACQTKLLDSNFGVSMGTSDQMTLTYADGDLLLHYRGGAPCSHNNMKRQTIINFKCNTSAESVGAGKPVFDHEDECLYYFNWETKFACLDASIAGGCRVNHNGHRYDLSALVKTHGDNWLALHDENGEKEQYLINVCHDIVHEGPATNCDPSTSICYTKGTSTKSLGRYIDSPVFNTNTNRTQITYKNGDICTGDRRISSTITFICRPGYEDSAPTLVRKSNDGCYYDFEWNTGAACELGHYEGDNCQIFGHGFTIDLNPLKKTDGSSYEVDSVLDASHDYRLNVCAAVSGTKCDGLATQNAGICQEPRDGNGDAFNTGQFNGKIHYYDGMINLTYAGGTPYNDVNQTPRKSEIVFLCDTEAGVGSPKFVLEASNQTYMFEWRTAYACPGSPMECAIVDETSGDQYDLSSLSMSDGNWVVESEAGGTRNKYYINVCRTVTRIPVGTGCSSFASVCRTTLDSNGQESMNVSSLGDVTSASLSVESPGRIKLRYESPGACTRNSSKVPYVTNIHFICRKDALSSNPSTPVQDGPCEYTITWETSAACSLNADVSVSTEQCTARDPATDYVFNLKPLRRSDTDGPYSVVVGDVTYKLNICGNISASVCPEVSAGVPSSICMVKGGVNTSLAQAGYKLEFSETGEMAITYDGVRLPNGQRKNVQIMFVCDQTQEIGNPQFERLEGETYIFIFPTALACSPTPTECLVQDEDGNQYNLESLSHTDYWMAIDTRDTATKYYINVCRPVNNVPHSTCPDEPIGGCQYANNGISYNMGYIQSKPTFYKESLSISYKNGDLCHKGKANEAHRSTRINFFCSASEDGPVFITETDTCEYVFNWRTPAACPLKSAKGDNCKVNEPRYNYEFDLNPLRNATKDYRVATTDGYVYLINVCGPLVEKTVGNCETTNGVGVCQTKPQQTFTPINAGLGNSMLEYQGGELTLTYRKGKDNCHGQYQRQTIIRFTCDLSKSGSEGPTFIEEAYNCKYVFEWPTRHACPPYEVGACAMTADDGSNYDLSPLSLTNDNYEYTDEQTHKRYMINVCRSLIHQKGSLCPYNAAACEVDLNKNNTALDKYVDIGEPTSSQLSYENGKLVLTYTGGALCDMERYKTHITFLCNKDAKDTSPAGHFMVGDCDHHFLWSTSAACPLNTTTDRPNSGDSGTGQSAVTCAVTTQTGRVLDLSSLTAKDTPWKVEDDDGHVYEFNVCAPLKTSKCNTTTADKIGVCQSSSGDGRTFNAGKVVSGLQYADGTVVQTLTGGDRCHDNRFERSTVITFLCNDHNGLGRPVFQGETDDCTYYIAWHTSLVCDHQVKCTVDTPTFTIDLSTVSRHTDQLVASTVGQSSFYLSVCTPLTPKKGILCPPGAAVCLVDPDNTDMQTSLGKPNSAPSYDPQKQEVTIVYTQGSTCDVDSTQNYTSKIIFTCQNSTVRSSPIFVAKTGCEYLFTWPVAEVCSKSTTTNKCGYTDPSTGQYYDLSHLKMNTPFEARDQQTGETYLINLCGSLSEINDPSLFPSSCGSAMVCRKSDGVSFGEPKNFEVVKDSLFLKFTYGNGGKCGGTQTAESHIMFQCDERAGDGKPQFVAGLGCDIQFQWKTNVVCPRARNVCRVEGPDRHLYDLSLLSKSMGAWNVTDAAGNLYYLGICSSVRGVDERCPANSGACMIQKGSVNPIALGAVTAQKSLSFNASDQSLVLEYGEGGPDACPRQRSEETTTRIIFTCGTTLGAPQFVDSPYNKDRCIFEFQWKTHLACKVQSESVQIKAGEVKDPRSGIVLNLKPIWNVTFEYHETQDSTETTYYILLNGTSTKCKDGVVCLKSHTASYQTLGTFTSAKYFLDDDKLEGRFSSQRQCTRKHSKDNVSSIIQFECASTNSTPRLLHNVDDCLYVFIWQTTLACEHPVIIGPAHPSGDSSSGTGSSTNTDTSASGGKSSSITTGTIVGIIATFLGAIVLCILLVVFHKKERRDSCLSSVRGVFTRRSSQYSQLPTGGVDDIFGEEDEIITVEDASGASASRDHVTTVSESQEETAPIIRTKPSSYHDDSDEDLLA